MSHQENPIGYKFSILSEDVATNDLFEDKTHERVSKNLLNIIQNSSKGVTIGLEGSWGSGKSTVIKLLKDKLKINAENKTLFFMFDAWAHDGDPLRRIFLESLIREIDPREEDNDLKRIKEKITGRKKIVEIKSKKNASRLGKYISLSALLIPLGSAFLGKVDYKDFVLPWSDYAGAPNFLFFLGLFFCFSPLWILIYWLRWGDRDEGKISWEFFSVDSKEDYTQDITEDGERTSIEFEDYFKCIIQTAIQKEFIDKSIIVIDNLDRVAPEHAKNIWSALQTFFQKRSNGCTELNWSDALWFVIPFDREGFHKIWKTNHNDEEVGKSFLKKCFQLIAEVPHPVMSGWSKYAETCMDEALGQWPEDERRKALSTYIRYASRLDKSPTPRDIKVFTNQVGLLGAMWGGEVSVEAICLYTLFKESFSTNNLRANLVVGQLPQAYQTDSNRSEICAELAGLLFGVNKKKGLQLLLGPEIKSAFNAAEGHILATLLEDHGDAFWIAYEHSKSEWMVGVGHADEYKIAVTQAFHDGLMHYKTHIARDIEQLRHVWIESFRNFNFSNFDYAPSLKSIIELSENNDNFVNSLYIFITEKLKNIISLIDDEQFPESGLFNIENVTTLLASVGKPINIVRYGKLNSPNWKLWLDHVENSGTEFNFVLPRDETINALVNEAQFGSIQPNDEILEYLIKTFKVRPNSTEWQFATEQIVKWMKIPNRIASCESIYGLAIDLAIQNKNNAFDKFKTCLKEEIFWTAGQLSSCKENPSLPILAAIVLGYELQEIKHVSSEVKSFWSATTDLDEITKIFNRFKQLNKIDTLWKLCRDMRNSTAALIIKHVDDQILFSDGAGARYIDEYSWASEEEIKNISKKLAVTGSFFKNEKDMKEKPVTYQLVYKIFYDLNDKEICAFIDDEISKVKKDDWRECIENTGELIDLVKSKNPYFSEALNDFLIEAVSGGLPTGISPALAEKLPNLLKKVTDLNRSFTTKILNAYFSIDKDYLEDNLFDTLSQLFSKQLSKVDENLLMERISLWMKLSNRERIEWISAQNIKPFKEPSEDLIALVELGLKADETTQNEIAILINEKFNLGIVIEIPEDREVESDLMENQQ